MNILFIEDMPEFKIKKITNQLDMHFCYEIISNSSSALRHLFTSVKEIDLIILDLGLPFSEDGNGYNKLEGLFIIEELIRKNFKVPLIINSMTEIPNEEELFEKYQKHCGIIKHVSDLDSNYLMKFIKENI